MTIQASSLEHLYNQGILNYIPYDLCQQAPMQANNMGYGQYGQLVHTYGNPSNHPLTQAYSSPYLQQAQQGNLYNTYTGDTFVSRNLKPQENQFSIKKNVLELGNNVQYETPNVQNSNNMNFRESIMAEANATNNDVTKRGKKSNSSFWKGLLAGGILVGTLACILKGKFIKF